MSSGRACLAVTPLEPRLKVQLTTYSRRSVKRRLTLPLAPVDENKSRLTRSLSAVSPSVENAKQQPFRLGRQRSKAITDADGKTPTDLLIEMIHSSPVHMMLVQGGPKMAYEIATSTEQDDSVDGQDLGGNDSEVYEVQNTTIKELEVEEETAENPNENDCSSGDELAADDTVLTNPSSEKLYSRSPSASPSKLKGHGDDDESEDELSLDAGPENLMGSPRPQPVRQHSLSLSSNTQAPKAKSRFLVTKRSHMAAFKTIHRRRPGQDGQEPAKGEKRISDGFSSDEAQRGPFRKKRRVENNELNIRSLELTQNGIATQKPTAPSLVRHKRRQPADMSKQVPLRGYYGSSQFGIDSPDPLQESFDTEEIPKMRSHSGLQMSEAIYDGDDELLGEPDYLDAGVNRAALTDKDDIESLGRSDGSLKGESQFANQDDEIVLLIEEDLNIIVPRTDTPEIETDNAAEESHEDLKGDEKSNSQLPPKRVTGARLDDGHGLTLRPNSHDWLQEVKRVSDTPPRRAARGRQS